jgi:hypothetical protein
MADSTLPNVLSQAGTPMAFAVQDDVSLIYLQNQSQTQQATQALQTFKDSGSINVYYQGQLVTVPASKVINQILSGQNLVKAGLGNPATDSTTPDIIVTLNPGFIWVGNPLKFTNKRAEHGGFSADDTHVALIVSGGALPRHVQGRTVSTPVATTQVAVTILESLGLDPNQLTGARIEKTRVLPGLNLPDDHGSARRGGNSSSAGDDTTTGPGHDGPARNAAVNNGGGPLTVGEDAELFGSLAGQPGPAPEAGHSDGKEGVNSGAGTNHGSSGALVMPAKKKAGTAALDALFAAGGFDGF